jgi:PhnB protein
MNFSVDKEKKKINVEREFAAPLPVVWDAWTKSELLDQWWAPKPWQAKTKSMDFREGGSWIYAMVGPNGEEHWAIAEYKSITPQKSFTGVDAFCDKNGKIDETMPRSLWDVQFKETGDSTMVFIETKYDKLEDLEKIIEMGFQEGFTAGLENLDALLLKLKS